MNFEKSIYLKGFELQFFLIEVHLREYFKSKVNNWIEPQNLKFIFLIKLRSKKNLEKDETSW